MSTIGHGNLDECCAILEQRFEDMVREFRTSMLLRAAALGDGDSEGVDDLNAPPAESLEPGLKWVRVDPSDQDQIDAIVCDARAEFRKEITRVRAAVLAAAKERRP